MNIILLIKIILFLFCLLIIYYLISNKFSKNVFSPFLISLFNNYLRNKTQKIKDSDIIIENGKINFNSIVINDYSLNDLMKELEKRKINKMENVALAYFRKGKLIIEIIETPLSLIYKGNIDYQTLVKINKNVNWLMTIIKQRNIRLDNIYYSFYMDDQVFIVRNEL